jgi:hypothetical protein
MGELAIKSFCIALAGAMFALGLGVQAAVPQLPCAGAAALAYPAPEAVPAIAVWHAVDLEQGKWQPPGCTGWPPSSHSGLVIALTGSLRFDGAIGGLLARVGAISALPKIQYWSTTDKKWRPLAYDASALTGPDAKTRRSDFSTADLIKDADLYYRENDSRSGEAVYRLRVYESTPERAVIASENVTPIRRFFLTLFQPGALQSVMFIQRVSPGIFGVYILSRTGEGTSAFADGHAESYVNRAVALYRQLAGIKTDQEPPAAP